MELTSAVLFRTLGPKPGIHSKAATFPSRASLARLSPHITGATSQTESCSSTLQDSLDHTGIAFVKCAMYSQATDLASKA